MLRRRFESRRTRVAFASRANKRRVTTGISSRLIVLAMALMVTSFALPGDGAPGELRGNKTPYRIRSWTTEDGLPQHQISCLKQTRDGYLWIGTHFGLARFDGLRFTSFDESTTPEILNESVDALAEDVEDTLWIGTAGGLLSYRNHRFEPLHITTQEKQGVRRICPARSGGLWLCDYESKITRLLKGQFHLVWQPPKRNEDNVISMREGTNGWLNIFTRSKWLTISPDLSEIRTNFVRQHGSPGWTAALLGDALDDAWIGTKQGMFKLEGNVCSPIAENALATNSVELIFQDRAGNLWAGSKEEFFGRWDGTDWLPIDMGDIVEKSSAIYVEQDAEGTIWVATQGGLVQLHEPLVTVYTKANGLARDNVWTVCEGNEGEIWAGTEEGLSRIGKSGKPENFLYTDGSRKAADRCVWPRRSGGVWTAKNNIGLFACIDGHFELAASPATLIDSITCLGEGSSGVLYVCTEGQVFGFRQDAPLPWSKAQSHLNVRAVRSLLETSDGTVWLGTGGHGVVRVQNGRTNYFTQQDGLSGNSVWAIFRTPDGTLWFGTNMGLTRYKRGVFFAYTRRHGLLEDPVNCILQDDNENLWLSGLSGVYRIRIAELDAVADGHEPLLHPYAVGTSDGFKNAETNGEKQPAGWKASDGRLWFPTVRGVVVIDPKKFPSNEPPPLAIIEQIKAGGRILDQYQTNSANTVSSNNPALINYPIAAGRGRVLEFQYTANSLVDSKRVKFRYRLVGADPDWRDETSERSVRYINLRPGDYRFQVKAANHNNVWNSQPAEFAFSIAPYIWQTKLFYPFCGAAVLAIAAGVQAYRLRWQRRLLKLEQQRALAAERARIARDLHDDLGTALTGLALELDVIGRDPKPELPVDHRLGQTAQRTRLLAERMREVVWSVNPRCDTVPSLASFLEQQIGQFLRADGIKVELDFPEDIPPLPIGGEARHQLALGVREALTNVIRHARATNVVLSLALDKDWLKVQVKDNGCGLQTSGRNGDGFRNMRDRLQSIGGTFDFSSEPGLGTTIIFRVPIIKSKSGASL